LLPHGHTLRASHLSNLPNNYLSYRQTIRNRKPSSCLGKRSDGTLRVQFPGKRVAWGNTVMGIHLPKEVRIGACLQYESTLTSLCSSGLPWATLHPAHHLNLVGWQSPTPTCTWCWLRTCLCLGNLIESRPPFLLTLLVTIAALLRRYSPSPHPLLRLLSHVPNVVR
jgi:hypothetical protein